MSYTNSTPCDSNDYQLTLYSSLLNDDEYTLNILPCKNGTAVVNEEGGMLVLGGGGEGGVDATVPSRTTEWFLEDGGGGDGAATTSATVGGVTTTEVATSEATTTDAVTTDAPVTTEAVEPEIVSNTNDNEEDSLESNADTDQDSDESVDLISSQISGESDEPNDSTEEETTGANDATDNTTDETEKEPGTTEEEEETNETAEADEPAETDIAKTEETVDESTEDSQEIHQETTETSTFYTCHPDPSALLSGEFSPDDSSATKYEVVYDYELFTTNDDIKDTVNQLENVMALELANQFGLVDCTQKRFVRRTLRKKRSDEGIVALDSEPVDEVLEGQSCTTSSEPDTMCTPIRGYMTFWSETDDTTEALKSIEADMADGSYQSDTISKLVYIGTPTDSKSEPQTSESQIAEANGSTQSQQMESTTTDSATSVFLPVGITIFLLSLICISLYIVRRRRNNDDRNGPKPTQHQQHQTLEAPPTMDLEDDINLLPSMEKLDMRPIYFTDSDSESVAGGGGLEEQRMEEVSLEESVSRSLDVSHEEDEEDLAYKVPVLAAQTAENQKLEEEDLQSSESSVFSHEENESSYGGSGSEASGLAAMGAASRLAVRMGSSDSTQ